MTQFYSRIDTELNGGVYNIPFSYIKKSEISVFINDEAISDWEFLNESQIKILTFPQNLPSNSIVTIKRNTDINQKVVDYSNQSMLKQENLNLSQDQLLNAVQEIYDNNIKFEIDTTQTIKDNQEETIDTLEENRQEILDILEENRQEILDIQEQFEEETNAAIKDFEDGIDAKIATVADAADRINTLDEDLAIATNAANEAVSQAQIAAQQAQIATEKVEEIANAKEVVLNVAQDITELNEQFKNEIESELENKANFDLSNLSELGEKHFLNKTQISNCLLEVPQRIKYSFVNGVITIKTGSVILFPYGVEDLTNQYPKGATFLNKNFKVYDRQFADGKFFVWAELVNDLVVSANLTNADRYIMYNSYVDYENTINSAVTHNASSGATPPTSNGLWYDTANNFVYYYVASQEKRLCSLPLGVITTSTSAIENIKQIFNGFGYIANTMYADKDVKGLIPNGRNTDGTLNNIEFETEKVLTKTITATSSVNGYIGLNANSILAYTKTSTRYYDEDKNYFFNGANTLGLIIAGDFKTVSGVITEFLPKNAFKAVDYNDKSTVSGWGMPSSKYINLTLGASDTTYTAPANGWYYLQKISGGANLYFYMTNLSSANIGTLQQGGGSSQGLWGYLPCKKGDVIKVNYNATGTTEAFQFIYAQGEV